MSRHRNEFIDTHCHLYWDDFRDDLPQVVSAARAAGVTRMIIPATDFPSFHQACSIADAFEDIFIAVGIHPHDAGKVPQDFADELRRLARHPKVVAIGEIGLDYYYDFCTPAVQHRVLHAQLNVARELALPVILHNRESDDDLLAVVREHQNGNLHGQFHCFSADTRYARRVLDAGFHISFTGNVSFKKSTLDSVLSYVPDDRLLIETDAPFMTPVPFRGKRNQPALIPLIARRFALTRHQSVSHISGITTRNAEDLFHLERKYSNERS